jgi:hypothetical protein
MKEPHRQRRAWRSHDTTVRGPDTAEDLMKSDNSRSQRKAKTKRPTNPSSTGVANSKRLQAASKRKARQATSPSAKARVLRTSYVHRSRAHTSSAGRRRQARRDAK